MTYYQQEVLRMRREFFPCDAVVSRCMEAKRMIDVGCCDGIDLDELCLALFVSKFHFIRQFSRIYGVTPHRYLTERRMEVAKGLLESGLGVGAVCCRVGFLSVPSFSMLFRRMTGVTPAAYRMRNFQ